MEHRTMGRTGMNVSVLGFGGAEIGFEGTSDADVEKLLGAALDAGLNVIDTAECYADSEAKIGRATSRRRDDFFLFTKCGHASGFELPDWDIQMLEQSIDRSLQRLQTDRVDLIQLHTCSEEMLRQGDVIEVVQRAKAAGKTRFIGYSGDNEAAKYAVECGVFDTLQTSLNVADQSALELYLPQALRSSMGVIAKRPIANTAWRYGEQEPDEKYHHTYWERLRELNYNWTSGDMNDAVSTALRWTLKAGVHTAIVGTKNPARWPQNAALLDTGPLSDEQFEAVRSRWAEVGQSWTGQG